MCHPNGRILSTSYQQERSTTILYFTIIGQRRMILRLYIVIGSLRSPTDGNVSCPYNHVNML